MSPDSTAFMPHASLNARANGSLAVKASALDLLPAAGELLWALVSILSWLICWEGTDISLQTAGSQRHPGAVSSCSTVLV